MSDDSKGESKGDGNRKAGLGINGNLVVNENPWPPGTSGNPAGYKKGQKNGVRASLRRLLKTNAPDEALRKLRNSHVDTGDGSFGSAIAAVLGVKAMSGDIKAIRELLKQTELPIELDNGDDPEGSRSKTLSPNASEIASALDRE